MNRSRQLVLVLGMHRSGTSVLTKLLIELGCEVGAEVLPEAPDNPEGFWEDQNVVDLNNEFLFRVDSCWNDPHPLPKDVWESKIAKSYQAKAKKLIDQEYGQTPVSVLKDPRLCRLLPLWKPALEDRFDQIRCLLMMRHFSEVSQSLAHRNGFSQHLTTLLWIQHVLLAESDTEAWPRLVLTFPSLIEEPRLQLERVGSFLGSPPDRDLEKIASSVRPDLRHHTEEEDEKTPDFPAFALATRIWKSRQDCARGEGLNPELTRTDLADFETILKAIPEDLKGTPREARGPLHAEIARIRDKEGVLAKVEGLESELARSHQACEDLKKENSRLQTLAEKNAAEISRIKHRLSWHLSKPLRWIENVIRPSGR
ncbi:MAG: hypothetical protein KDN19_22215 [Verrucomicrobiae bacterium]|nr:hypothetical protein [Verrucomicrobiae bacterium]